MSDERVLREKLEQVRVELRQAKAELDKQRELHAREQKSLHKSLEDTRKEAARLRARIEKERAREQERAAALPTPSEAVLAESPGAAAHVLVALARAPPSMEEALLVLSRLLRMSPVDVRMRLAQPPPSVLARLPALEADMLRDVLTAEGFQVVCAEVPQLASGLRTVRRFILEERHLSVEDTWGERQQVPYSELRLLVRGRRKSISIERKEEVEFSSSNRGARVKRHVEEKTEHIENFLWVYGGGWKGAFSEATSFAGLGERRGPTRFAALQTLLGELRQRAPQAVVDERFVQATRPSLPLVGPERSQEALAALLYEAVEAGLWPGA